MEKNKLLIYVFLLFSVGLLYGQVPEKLSYQAIIRNNSNVLVANSPVGMQISILQTSASGTVVFSETHTPTTNANGLLSLQIGNGTPVLGSFSAINWANGPYFVKTETDPAGGTNYTVTGTSQLLSVPYAQLAENVLNPKFSASVSSYSNTSLAKTARNLWQDDPNINVVVPEAGKYLLMFYGSAFNDNETIIGVDSSYDNNCYVRVYNSTAATELVNEVAIELYFDQFGSNNIKRKYNLVRPSKSVFVNLNAGDVLKLQYIVYGFGTPLPSGTWYIGNGGVSILKIGN
ncbi:hypothetical protein NAT51_05340 [Flavobacterium amniphilum]|uniref:hypothetical protein n=1 Tax=Flavobacterium amniphilum TaxID=1834035 RepID=UPI00202A79FA|nr:hypothetical protein [Flavobacterium amniphilum]MCL9804930.1 hypothetical protein [Flavobacterium amniphilum]